MMWSKNTNGNLMIGKGKERKEGRGGEGRERQGIGTDVSQEIWRNTHVDAAGAQSCPVNFLFDWQFS